MNASLIIIKAMANNSRRTLKWLKPSSLRDGLAILKTRHFVLLTLFGICTIFYYFGELVDFAGWEALRWEFWYTVHDIHRLLFLVPIVYAGYFFRVQGAIIVTVASLIVFLPRAILISPFPEPIFRAILSTTVMGVVGSLAGVMRNKQSVAWGIEAPVRNESNSHGKIENGISNEVFTAGDLEIDLSRRVVKLRRQVLKLTPKEYELLSSLVRNSGKVVSHKDILHNVWGSEYNRENEYLRTFVRQLRRKIEDDPSNPHFIVTEQGIGYRFVMPEEHPR